MQNKLRLLVAALAVSSQSANTLGRDNPDKITNKSGHCVIIGSKKHTLVENLVVGPCAGAGILVTNSSNVTIRNVTITDTVGPGVEIRDSRSITVTNSKITRTSTSVYAISSTAIQVVENKLSEVQGPMPRGQFVQFNKVYGRDNRIADNIAENTIGHSFPEDAISLFMSSGDENSPILIEDNAIRGGGPSLSGGGIMVGDYGGNNIIVRHNTLSNPGQYGIGISGGRNILVEYNHVAARQQPFTNVGIYVWAQNGAPCANITVRKNKVRWINSAGRSNPWWDAKNCGAIKSLDTNAFFNR